MKSIRFLSVIILSLFLSGAVLATEYTLSDLGGRCRSTSGRVTTITGVTLDDNRVLRGTTNMGGFVISCSEPSDGETRCGCHLWQPRIRTGRFGNCIGGNTGIECVSGTSAATCLSNLRNSTTLKNFLNAVMWAE